MGEKLYPSPLNAVGRPPGPSGKGYHGRRMIIARLEWRTHVDFLPAVILWREAGAVCIEWEPHHGQPPRHTWIPEDDVQPLIRLPRT